MKFTRLQQQRLRSTPLHGTITLVWLVSRITGPISRTTSLSAMVRRSLRACLSGRRGIPSVLCKALSIRLWCL